MDYWLFKLANQMGRHKKLNNRKINFVIYNPSKMEFQRGILFSACPWFCHSMIPKFRQHLMILLFNFARFCLILFKFTPHHITIRQCMFDRKIGGWRVSITRVIPLCNSYNKMFELWLIVHILWNQLLIALTGSFQHFADMLQTYWRCAWRSLMLKKKIFLTNWQGF